MMRFAFRSLRRGALAAPACAVPRGLNREAAVAGSACLEDGQVLRSGFYAYFDPVNCSADSGPGAAVSMSIEATRRACRQHSKP